MDALTSERAMHVVLEQGACYPGIPARYGDRYILAVWDAEEAPVRADLTAAGADAEWSGRADGHLSRLRLPVWQTSRTGPVAWTGAPDPPPPDPGRARCRSRSPRVLLLVLSGTLVWRAAHHDDASDVTRADAIVVLGAAQYQGTPSPVLLGRLQHALLLWKQGRAKLLVTVGSNRPGDRSTEAASGATT